MNIALFDLDHTLLPIDSDYTWARFTNEIGWTDPEESLRQNDIFYQQYVAGTLDMCEYVRFVTRAVRAHTLREAQAAQQRYLDEFIRPQITRPALDLLAAHRQAGDALVMITATNRFIAGPIGEALGFADDHIIATELQRDTRGHITGEIDGEPNLREGKVHNFGLWLARRNLASEQVRVTFYSDSMNDLPLLERAAVPVATNPDDRLRAHATREGWRILDLFPTH